MDSRLRRNVEPQLRPEDTWDQMVAVAERYSATIYRTGGYKGSDRSQASSSKTYTLKKENTYRKPSTTSMPRNTGKGKAPGKKRTYTKSNKPSTAEIDRHKAEGACFYCGESGHMQMNAQRKKLRPTMFGCLRKAQTAAKANMSPIRTAQRS